jgi:uncharacterized protein YjlB
MFGGEGNPGKIETTVNKGDVIIIPAGVSHRLKKDLEGGFQMVGSYPPGLRWDMCYGKDDERDEVAQIAKLEWFVKDPIYGHDGPIHSKPSQE